MTFRCIDPRSGVIGAVRRRTFVVALILLAPSLGAQTAGEDAVAVVVRLHEALVQVAAAEGDTADRFDALWPVIVETHDLPYIARLTVRRYWRDWTDEERDAFVSAFERLSVMTYASRFSAVGSDTFELVGTQPDGERIEVNALINRNEGDDVTMDYLLRHDGENWRIVNVLADRVSDLALKIDEYGRILDSGTVQDLIAELESQTNTLQN